MERGGIFQGQGWRKQTVGCGFWIETEERESQSEIKRNLEWMFSPKTKLGPSLFLSTIPRGTKLDRSYYGFSAWAIFKTHTEGEIGTALLWFLVHTWMYSLYLWLSLSCRCTTFTWWVTITYFDSSVILKAENEDWFGSSSKVVNSSKLKDKWLDSMVDESTGGPEGAEKRLTGQKKRVMRWSGQLHTSMLTSASCF